MTSEIISYNTQGTCCKVINIEIEDNKIKNIEFLGGCHGNLQGIAKLVIGQDVDVIEEKLKGIKCGATPTSCPDQLSKCLEKYRANRTAVRIS